MQQNIVVNKPSTVYIKFNGTMPKLFCLRDSKGDVYYYRYLDGSTPMIKFRIPDSGSFNSDNDFKVEKIVPIEIPDDLPVLPPAQRDRWKSVTYRYNPNLASVASIHTDTGLIEHGPRYDVLIKPMQIFIDLHEKGHFFYAKESYCDLFALVNFIRMGYNESTAYYCLSDVIKRSPEQLQRVKYLFDNIGKTIQPNFNPGK